MIGKTIDRVEPREYGSIVRVWFTDGTAADFESHGYDDTDISTKLLGPEDFERERTEAIQEAYRRQAEKERQARLAAEREAKRAEMQELLTPRQYERWLDQQRPMRHFEAAMKAEFEGAIKQQLADTSRLLFGGQS